MLEGVDQHEVDLGAGGQVVIPPLLLEKLRWRPGHRLLVEQTDEGLLITEIEAPGVEP
jgi:bifunctional DNA-binding transcriptional regulator/antitoxin component of YhaV-PrlF toxin-antitoxin module